MNHTIKALVVEDNPSDVELLRHYLKEADVEPVEHITVGLVSEAIEKIDDFGPDVILLDLMLPDAEAIESVLKIRKATDLPIVVLTGMNDEKMAAEADRAGAQDYVIKWQLGAHGIVRAIKYAIEKRRLQLDLESTRQRDARDREMTALESLSSPERSSVTARIFGITTLSQSSPEIFNEIKDRYKKALGLVVEEAVISTDYGASDELRSIADYLGFLKAGPRDVVELHKAGMKEMVSTENALKAKAYMEQGRIAVLELMGFLVSYYRSFCAGSSHTLSSETDLEETT